MTKDGERQGLPIGHFADQAAFAAWIAEQPATSPGLWLRLAKRGSGFASTLTKQEALDVALCHGWIDGQLDKFDDVTWLVRFTPRRPGGRWSAINVKRARQLVESGQMREAGRAEIDAARADGRWDAAYAPPSSMQVPDDLRRALDANPTAAAFFATLTSANRYAILYRIDAVKRPETRARKIADYVAMCARGDVIYPKR